MKKTLLYLILTLLWSSTYLSAEPTRLVVRAKAKDAKFIGSSIGGAMVIVRDGTTNELLAKGLTKGSTGNTTVLMREAHQRFKPLTDDNTAKFETSLDIDAPTFVTVEVIAPYSKRQAAVTSSTQLWLIPGKHIDGDGLILEIPGVVIDILSPQTHERIPLQNNMQLEIKANVVMMCGCPVQEKGIWDAKDFEVMAVLKKGDQVHNIPLKITHKTSTFSAMATLSEGGTYDLTVYAYSAKTGNTGVDKTSFILQE
ncbi:hypothetical protein AAG747_23775 [Rapidithrix thailandica]|uniref:Uncharacterized protein n=1 Tax=Rapidithrix thailandica TaxID=413964 RepID=A0AAW9SJF1_9BACT